MCISHNPIYLEASWDIIFTRLEIIDRILYIASMNYLYVYNNKAWVYYFTCNHCRWLYVK